MSQDLQLFNRGPATQIEPWAAGGGGTTALASPIPQANPLLKIHRSMRGRYVIATVLAVLGAAQFQFVFQAADPDLPRDTRDQIFATLMGGNMDVLKALNNVNIASVAQAGLAQ